MEIAILEGLAAIHTPFLTAVMLAFTYMGEVGAIWIAAAAVLLAFRKTRPCGVVLAAALIIDFLVVNLALKNIVARPRPFTVSEELLAFLEQIEYKLPSGWSFPSGHAAVSFCAAAVLTCFYKGKGAWSIAAAALIAFSRLYLGVHYLTDVLAGAAIGALIGVLCGHYGKILCAKVKETNKERKRKKKEEIDD